MRIRTYGTSGPVVIVLHGGPAAVGEAAPIARGLADSFRVLEPWQRGSGDEPLSVSRHVADLHELVESCGDDTRPALVGEAWRLLMRRRIRATPVPSSSLVVAPSIRQRVPACGRSSKSVWTTPCGDAWGTCPRSFPIPASGSRRRTS